MAPLDKTGLFNLLATIDGQLRRKITIVAIGGTALTLLDVKESTIDIDLSFPDNDLEEFEKALKMLPKPGFRIHYFSDGDIFGVTVPDDYLKKSPSVKKFKRIELRALSPIDVVVTKIARLNPRDKQDIEACTKRFRLSEEEIKTRAGQVELAGSEEQYKANLHLVLNAIFHQQRHQ
jgi:hypothetical protein